MYQQQIPEEQLDILFSWLDSFSSLSGAFRQTQSRAYEGVSAESTGDFKALKPDYFCGIKLHRTIN